MNYKNIVFDLDGTLVDSRPGIQFAATIAIKLILPARDAINLQNKIGPPIREILQKELEDLEQKVFDEVIAAFRFIYDNFAWRMVSIYDGVLEALESLSKLGMGNFVVTNKPIGPTKNILSHFHMMNYFREVICPDVKTPNFSTKSAMVSYLMEHHHLRSSETVLIGDSSDDAQAAAACKLSFIPVVFGYGDFLESHRLRGQQVLKAYCDLIGLLRCLNQGETK